LSTKNLQFVFIYFKKLIFSSIIIVILCSPSVRADFDPVLAARLQNAIDSVRNYWNYTGVSASVFIPSMGTWTGTSGVSHGTAGITPDMKFGIASNTKTFIAVLMLKLQEMSILSLDDSLYKWIPNYQYVDSTITIRQLLNHTSGVFNYTTYPGFVNAISDTGRFWTPEEILTTFLNQPYFNPGAGFQYSNTNYILAGTVIKAATGNSVSYNLRQLILNPINLDNTYLPLEEFISDTIAHGWSNGVEFKYPVTSYISTGWTSGAMYSTAGNMVRFYKDLFSLQIINQSSLNQMLTFPQQPIGIYGLGIGMGLFGGRTKLFHGGGITGYTSFTGIDTTEKFIISVLINKTPSDPINFIVPLDNIILDHIITGINNPGISLPAEYSLSQNYPNPFNPSTKIRYTLKEEGNVKLLIYDIKGELISTLVNERQQSGSYEVDFTLPANISTGVYIYRFTVSDNNSHSMIFSDVKKMVYLK
jgi:D-alanyl-D-alanine carboxypeptidase